MLRDYEILYIVRPELDEERLNEAIATVNRLIENLGGKSQKTDIWGRRRLAYEVRHLREGQYVLTDFQVEPASVPEMEATLKISETVFRHLIVRKPEPRPARNGRRRAAASQEAAAAEPAPAEPAPTPETATPAAVQAPEPTTASAPTAETASEVPAEPSPEPVAEQAPAEEPGS
ncbi:MAG: 30S ribosomal protein S6 [Candidatus Dormibacteraeota bacterium]|nr:30S ribosomal protein S6 [Candidatus Dormibacteraeota bacterium]